MVLPGRSLHLLATHICWQSTAFCILQELPTKTSLCGGVAPAITHESADEKEQDKAARVLCPQVLQLEDNGNKSLNNAVMAGAPGLDIWDSMQHLLKDRWALLPLSFHDCHAPQITVSLQRTCALHG